MAARSSTSSSPAATSAAGGATFYTTGMEYSPTSATGTGWEHAPWHCDAAGGVGCGEAHGGTSLKSALASRGYAVSPSALSLSQIRKQRAWN
jgi:hypothetical protein